jgi:hypothetical protein
MSQETLYVVRDGAGALYGPANVPTLRQWVGEGRITANMHIAPQGTQQFILAGEMFDLADAFAPGPQQSAPGALAHTQQNPYGQNPYDQAQYPQQNPNYQTPYQQPWQSKSSGLAIAALCFGIGGFACGIFSIVGIILGHMARGQIRREPERYEGWGLATAGMIIGYVLTAFTALVILAYILIIALVIANP